MEAAPVSRSAAWPGGQAVSGGSGDGADHLHRFIRHEANAVFAVPGEAASGEYVGQRLRHPGAVGGAATDLR